MRVFSLVTHLLGAGHLTRAAALGRAFARAGHEVTLVSGGLPSALIRSDGLRLVQLPPVRADGTDFRTLLDETGSRASAAVLDRRRQLALEAVRETRPDVVITELFPFGRRVLAAEFQAVVDAAREPSARSLIAASVRDILASPAKPERVAETHRRLREAYDLVLVHGDPRLAHLEDSWPVDEHVRGLVRYTGYVDESEPSPAAPAARTGEIVVSGGSSAESLPLYRAAVAAARLIPDRPWRILVGRGVGEPAFADLARAAPDHAGVERARADFRALLARAGLSLSQAGYNTTVDLLRAGVPAILVPFEGGAETEQRVRAERLAARGFAMVLREAELSPERLAGAVRTALAGRAPQARSRVDLAGAQRSVAIVEEEHARRRHSRSAPRTTSP